MNSAPDAHAAPSTAAQRRVLSGVVSLAGREVVMRLVSVVGSIALARLLDPRAFGLFAIALFVVNLCELLVRLGLGPAFVRKPGELSAHDLACLFTFQLVWALVLAAFLVGASPLIGVLYRSDEVVWLVRGLAVVMVVNGLRAVPLVLAERRLAFGPVALSETSGHIAYYLSAVPAAAAGLRTGSFLIGMLSAAVVGTAILYRQVGWRPSLRLSWQPIREHLRFGLLVQAQSAATFIKDTMMFSLGGFLYGASATGYLVWANQVALTPMVVAQLVARVSYPAWSKLQDDTAALAASVATTVRWTYRLALPAAAVLAGLSPEIIEHVYGTQWRPAQSSVYLLCATMVLTLGTTILIPALHAQGRALAALRAGAAWAALTWLLALLLATAGLGFQALPLAMALASAGALGIALFEARHLRLDLVRLVGVPLLTALASLLILVLLGPVLVHGFPTLIAVASIIGAGALLANVWTDRVTVSTLVRSALR